MSTRKRILKDIRVFQEKHGLSDSAIGFGAVSDNKLILRLKRGADVTTETMDEIYKFMNHYEERNYSQT